MPQEVIFSNDVCNELQHTLDRLHPDKVFILVDENTNRHVLPRLLDAAFDATVIEIGAGEQYKTLETVTLLWQELVAAVASRQSVLVNVGGGTVCDLGGFAASTFKRGIRFINIPTTILSAVDASVGGKTGFDFNGLKNVIGIFNVAEQVIISSCFFDTLPRREVLSGYAEMLKHALLKDGHEYSQLLHIDPTGESWENKLDIIENSVKIKQEFVNADPYDNGARHALNLGHTVGHALESLAIQQGNPVTHGHAVACGMVAEMVLSHMIHEFSSSELQRLATFVRNHYGAVHITCNDYPSLLQRMHQDKKNETRAINCTLLRRIGEPIINYHITDDDMQTALDIYRDLMGI